MKRAKLRGMSVSELVDQFTAIALDQDKALFDDNLAEFATLYRQMDDVRNELKSRPQDQRVALLPLYDHPNAQVRLKAAVTTLVVAPQAARSVLKVVAASRRQPQAGDAGMLLQGLDDGSFIPD